MNALIFLLLSVVYIAILAALIVAAYVAPKITGQIETKTSEALKEMVSKIGGAESAVTPLNFQSLSKDQLTSIENRLASFSGTIASICAEHCITLPFEGTHCRSVCG